MSGIAYTLYITEPKSRNLDMRVSPDETEWRRLEEFHTIDALVHSLREDLADLLPAGYTIELTKEVAE